MKVSHSIYWKITVPFILLVLAGMGILGFYMVDSAKKTQINHLEAQLTNEAKLVAKISLPAFADLGKQSELDNIAKTNGKEIQARITLIAKDGIVLGDTDQDPQTMENHATRPEVVAALSSGLGQSARYSATLHKNMMYVAVPVISQGQVLGIARVALPLTTVESSVNSAVMTIVSGIAVVTILVILAAALIARMITQPVRRITKAAEGIAAGKLDQKIQVRSNDEIGQLGHTFNEMSSNLRKLIGEISTERTKLLTVLANMTDGVVMADAEGKIILANQATERLFNFQEKDAITKPLIEIIRDYEADEVLKLCLRTGRTQTTQFESIESKQFIRAIAIPIKEGNLTGALLLFQNLTELRSMQTMRRELIGNISHELRTPIAGIKAMVETLKDSAINDKEAAIDFLTRIDGEVDRLTQMVSELTELSRIETGRVELRMAPTNLNLLVEEVVAQMLPLAQKQEVDIVTDLAATLPLVRADKERIRQTVINLVHNAIKFNHAGGKVTVSTGADMESVTVSVSDIGIGISKKDLPHVFERFYKSDKARTRGGSGLGLAIAKHTIQAHGGSIHAQSEEGKGSTFRFSLTLNANSDTNNP
ncbi:MAG: ATP-binding protein [Dehalococcoidales bacterium]|nr:ATP-binding protein [Dehalococcoidales bacterium]